MNFRVFLVCVLVFTAGVSPAVAFGFFDLFHKDKGDDDVKKLAELESQILSLNDRPGLMKFINLNMDDQGVWLVEIVIRSGSEEYVYYLVRNSTSRYGLAVVSRSRPEKEGDGVVWRLYPTVGQTEEGLRLLEEKHLSAGLVLEAVLLYRRVEGDNLPTLGEFVANSSWLGKYSRLLRWLF